MEEHYDVVVIGSGFGGSMTALGLARALKARGRGERVLMLERGTWWTTPVATVQDKQVKTYGFLRDEKRQPVQLWSSAENFRGFLDLYTRCVRRKHNEDGLYDLTVFGRKGLFGLRRNDGVTILRACGVGGGSLVYANVTIRPPDAVTEDPRWPLTWTARERDEYYELARDAIGKGVIHALYQRDVARDAGKAIPAPPKPVHTGLSNIATFSPRLNPRWLELPDPLNSKRRLRRIDLAHSTAADDHNALWIDRARVFQTRMAKLTDEYGTVDSSINDINAEPGPFDPAGAPKNYCERQGRCIIGCLPGARHTLNKQLMGAILGTPKGDPPGFPDLHMNALCEVDTIEALPAGGYRIHYRVRDRERPDRATKRSVHADRGRRGRHRGHQRDHAAVALERPAAEPQRAARHGILDQRRLPCVPGQDARPREPHAGPVTTSFAHFSLADPERFHTIEDNGIPRAFSSLTGHGVPLLQSLSKGRRRPLFLLFRGRAVSAGPRAGVRAGAGAQPQRAPVRVRLRRRVDREHDVRRRDGTRGVRGAVPPRPLGRHDVARAPHGRQTVS